MLFFGVNVIQLLLACLQIGTLFAALFGIAAFFRRRNYSPAVSLSFALAIVGVASIFCFWLALISLSTHFLVDLSALLGLVFIAILFCIAIDRKQHRDEIALPLVFAAACGLVLTLWVFAGAPLDMPMNVMRTRWAHGLPNDNTIPLLFAQALYDGQIPHPLFHDWLSSDRPPLQTGLLLLTPGHLFLGPNEFIYQPAGVGAQMIALAAVWIFLRCFTNDKKVILAALGATFLSPFFIVNGSYVWPKLFAAALIMPAVLLHFTALGEEIASARLRGVLTGALVALSLLANGGSLFVILGMLMAALVLRRFGSPVYIATAVLTFTLLYAPWLGYQTYVDPPGNRLAKWHLAGSIPIDDRSTFQAVRETYANLSLQSYVQGRVQNLVTLSAMVPDVFTNSASALTSLFAGDVRRAAHILRDDVRMPQFFGTVAAGGLLGLAFFLLPFGLFEARLRSLCLVVLCSLAVWVILMIGPSSTLVHQGSLLALLFVVPGAVLALSQRSRRGALALAGVHSALTFFQYSLF